jgi:hypothetical protein
MSDEPNAITNQDRSPKYPRLSLEEAIAKIKNVHKQAGKSSIAVETLATALGYKNAGAGGTIMVVSALHQYGLLDRGSDRKYSTSPLAVRILHPTGDEQLYQSLRQAALTPPIFTEIRNTLHDCSEAVLASHLVQSRFTPEGAAKAAAIYKKNSAFAKLDLADTSKIEENKGMTDSQAKPKVHHDLGQFVTPKPISQPPDTYAPHPAENARRLSLPLENGHFISIPQMSEDDFNLFLETLQLWKRRIVIKSEPKEPQGSE